MVHPLMPISLFALYVTGRQRFVDYHWVVVLLSNYICFAITPFVRAMPSRLLKVYDSFRMPPSRVESLNHRILQRASIQAITFPAAMSRLPRLRPWSYFASTPGWA
jgi:hypothetical protein